ncbi:STY4534 family ICE replication protein [Billgrantia lactosivorans]|uniref:STY4534 family ICE replication protein n=1 Tax=Billgrantia lactosivorans TaxID=2185141 RepID=UPI000DAF38E1
MTTQNASTGFFDLHITGLGYLNRIREVTPKRGKAFWACDIAALTGAADDVSYTRFDCRVSGRQAEKLVKRCEQAVNMDKKVLIGFRLGDLWTDTFVYQKGKRQGETGVSLKARLLFVSWIKINGDMVYQEPRRDDDQQEQYEQMAATEDAAPLQPDPVPTQPNGYAAAHAGGSAGSFESPAAGSF